MRKFYLLVAAVMTFAFTTAQTNLVQNPGFENGFTSWTKGPTGSYTAPSVITTDPHGGTSCAAYVGLTATTGFYQEIPVTAGNEYTVSFWYKTTGTTGNGARIWSGFKDTGGTFFYLNGTGSANDDPLRNDNEYLTKSDTWVQKSVTFTAPAGATIFQLAVRAYSNSSVYFDDFSLVEGTLGVEDIHAGETKAVLSHTLISDQVSVVLDGTSKVEFYSVNGSLAKSVTVSANQPINTQDLAKGVYVVRVVNNGKSETVKVVKK